ncbi:hypothetical protein FS749_000347, partial [Ceratobasidium sp. UAMH 11750]
VNPYHRVQEYLDNIELHEGSNVTWSKGSWSKFHGNGKATTGGEFHVETMLSTKGEYITRIVSKDTINVVIAAAGAAQPSPSEMVAALKEYISSLKG